MVKTVGELIDELKNYENDMMVKIVIDEEAGGIEGGDVHEIQNVQELMGQVVVRSKEQD